MDKTLLAGGLVAAIAAGWSQLKAFASYVSSFVVVRATVDLELVHPIDRYFRDHWRPAPSGLLIFRGKYLWFKGRSQSTLVPFKIPPTSSLFYKGRRWVVLQKKDESLTITYLRGTLNIEALIKDALMRYEQTRMPLKTSRFQILTIMGHDKSRAYSSGSGAQLGQADEAPARVTSIPMPTLDTSKDKSFMYDNSEWVFDSTEDPFKALYYPPHIQKHIDRAQQWLDSSEWYAERTIPWRLGYMFTGPGGTGKTSLARAVAQSLGIPVYQYYLSTLSDQEFVREWTNMHSPCMALLEDFDSVFNGRENVTADKTLTFDCILNQISGINASSGILLVVTTNHLEKIDPAMGVSRIAGDKVSTRPGRIDVVIEVGNMDLKGRQHMANRILKDWPQEIDALVNTAREVTPSVFQEMCLQRALELLAEEDAAKYGKPPVLEVING